MAYERCRASVCRAATQEAWHRCLRWRDRPGGEIIAHPAGRTALLSRLQLAALPGAAGPATLKEVETLFRPDPTVPLCGPD